MEKELKTKAIKASIFKGLFAFVVFSFLLNVVVWIVTTITNTSFIKPMIFTIIIIALISICYFIKELLFIKKSRLTYGTIIDVQKSNPDNSQAFHNYIIEYLDENNQTKQTIIYEQFGDNDNEVQEDIKIFFEEGQNKIGKKVPILYVANNDKKTIVFINLAE